MMYFHRYGFITDFFEKRMNQSQGKDGIYESHFDDDDMFEICKRNDFVASIWKNNERFRTSRILYSPNMCMVIFQFRLCFSVINDPDKNDPNLFASNKIVTAKYSWWSFLFIFLYENFNPLVKFANFYFLCIAVLEVFYHCFIFIFSVLGLFH